MRIANKIAISFLVTGIMLAGLIASIIGLIEKTNLEHYIYDQLIMTLIVIPIMAWLIGLYVTRIIAGPLWKLREGVEIVGSGDLDHKIDVDSRDEIGGLSMAFNKMTADLKAATVSIDKLNKECRDHDKSERELRENEERYRRLFELSNDAVFLYDFEGNILDVNSKACDMLGYDRESLLKMTFLKLYTEDELARSTEAFKTEVETCSMRFESKFRRVDGTVIDVDISSSVVDMKKEIMQGIVRDITERKILEEALKESEERFRTFMETASDLMYIVDKDGNFIYVNASIARTLGYSKKEMAEMSVTGILDEKTLEEHETKLKELIDKTEIAYEPAWLTKDGKVIYGELKVVAIYSEGKFLGSRGVFRDITERKKVEESQRLAHLGELTAHMAHEVNNPLAVISSRAELSLLEEIKNKEIEDHLNIIMDQCDRAKDMVQRLLKFSKPSKGEVKEVDINDSIDFMVDLVEKQFLSNKVRITRLFTPSLPPIKIDEKQVQEVFINLLRNAADAMTEGGTITISTLQEGDNLRIDFTDTGGGISDDDMKKIFDPFFTTKEKGTGLGLSVCFGIIKAHGGTLKYTSRPGKGTTAAITLPL